VSRWRRGRPVRRRRVRWWHLWWCRGQYAHPCGAGRGGSRRWPDGGRARLDQRLPETWRKLCELLQRQGRVGPDLFQTHSAVHDGGHHLHLGTVRTADTHGEPRRLGGGSRGAQAMACAGAMAPQLPLRARRQQWVPVRRTAIPFVRAIRQVAGTRGSLRHGGTVDPAAWAGATRRARPRRGQP
jgi:hypothetical protein